MMLMRICILIKLIEDNQAKLTRIKGIYEFVNQLKPPEQPTGTCTI